MLAARPLQSFRLGEKWVLVCRVADANPGDFLGKEFWFYDGGRRAGRIRIEGLSTAWGSEQGTFDFAYSGDEIRPEQLAEKPLICEGRYEDAPQEEIHVA